MDQIKIMELLDTILTAEEELDIHICKAHDRNCKACPFYRHEHCTLDEVRWSILNVKRGNY